MALASAGFALVLRLPALLTWSWRVGTCLSPSPFGALYFYTNIKTTFRPDIKGDYPLNLSILISGGKENNCDSLSNGE